MAALASRIWEGLERELEADLEFVRSGILVAAESEEDEKRLHEALKVARDHDIASELVGAKQIECLVPGGACRWKIGLFAPSDGHAEPSKATLAFAAAARRHGATVLEGVEALAIESAKSATVDIVTDQGRRSAHAVLCVQGIAGAELLRPLGVGLPIQPVRACVAQTNPTGFTGSVPVWSPSIAFRPRKDGSFYLGNGYRGIDAEYDIGLHSLRDVPLFLSTFAQNRSVIRLRLGAESLEIIRHQLRHLALTMPATEPRVNAHLVALNEARFYENLPQFRGLGIQRSWAGRIDATPDLIPIIGRLPDTNVYVATGFNGHGFALAPAVGQLLGELILDGAPTLDLRRFRPTRFREGEIDRQSGIL